MGTVADKLALLAQTKANIKTAIEEQGQTVGDAPFSAYPEKIRSISGGGGESTPPSPEEVYKSTRPDDWLPMPEPQDNELYLLFLISDGVSGLIAFTVTCTGQYTVSLGTVTDGTFTAQSSVNANSGEKYEAELFADDYENLTSDGFKQVMIKVSGTDILSWAAASHTKRSTISWNIVEMKGKLPELTSVAPHAYGLRYFSLLGPNNISSMEKMFNNCRNLITILELDTSVTTDMTSAFNLCESLVSIPQLNTQNVTTMRSMFGTCSSLTSIPQLNTENVTDMSNMFANCSSLKTIPELNTKNVTSMGSMFNNCYSIFSIPKLDTRNVTVMQNMFRSCLSLPSIPLLDTKNVTIMTTMFNSCTSLTSVPYLNIGSVTSLNNIFSGCIALEKIIFDPTTGYAGGPLDVSTCSLGKTAIVDLFESLPTANPTRTLKLTGNPGVSELTDADILIATEKGWSLTI